MPERCERCGGTELETIPALQAVDELVAEYLPSAELQDLCEQLWLLELIVFVCKNNPQQATLCPTCRSHRR